MLYRYGGDIFHALSASLWQKQGQPIVSEREKLKQVCNQLNAKCHTQVMRMIEDDRNMPNSIEEFDADSFINSLDKDLWEAVCLLTQPLDTNKINAYAENPQNFHCVCNVFHNKPPMLLSFTHSHD